MQVQDIMTKDVISVQPEDHVAKAARLMLQYHISGLPWSTQRVRWSASSPRAISSAQRTRHREASFLVARDARWPGKSADDYVHASGRKVGKL